MITNQICINEHDRPNSLTDIHNEWIEQFSEKCM